MTAALSEEAPPVNGWTTDDLDELPEDGRRRELIDGVLIVPPSPSTAHQTLALRLGSAMDSACPADLFVTQGVEVRVNKRRSLVPDLLVVTAEAARRNPSRYSPHEVTLVVEIVSPGSQTMDRFAKPALYAEAGIPFYWRIELADGVEVHTHRLDPGKVAYMETGIFTQVVDVDEPWTMALTLARLKP